MYAILHVSALQYNYIKKFLIYNSILNKLYKFY